MNVPRHDEAWTAQGDPAADGRRVAAMYRGDGVRVEVASGTRLQGHDAIARQAHGFFLAVPDAVCTWRNVSEAADGTVTLEWTFTGTHTGDIEGWPARGEAVQLMGVSVCDMDGDLIREERAYWDWSALLAPTKPS